MFKKLSKVAPFAFAFAPMLVLAQVTGTGLFTGDASGISSILKGVGTIIDWVVLIVIAIAILFFLLALLKYITKAGDEKERGAARQSMIWGVIIIAVMASVWGLVKVLQDATGVDTNATVQVPETPFSNDLDDVTD